jgi:nucleoside-diphosphate-sugar epimerase
VDERSLIDNTQNAAYGRHRYELEEFCRARFDTTVVRLPGMFGRGLKKNVIYDLLHGLPVDGVPANARFQYYDVDRVWGDLDRILGARVAVANITSEPVVIGDVVQDVFGHTLPLAFAPSAANYDVRSIHAGLAGGSDGYWYDAATVMSGLRSFVADERAR